LRGENCGRVEIPYPLEAARLGFLLFWCSRAGEISLLRTSSCLVYGLGVLVQDNALEVHICAVRKALGPDRGTLKTSFGRGYLLVGDWKDSEGKHVAVSVARSVADPSAAVL